VQSPRLPSVHWPLPVYGRTELDLAAALDGLAAAYGRTVLGAGF
jgi:hypothetical protein